MVKRINDWIVKTGGDMPKSQPGKTNPRYSHGYATKPVYKLWNTMKTRCNNPNRYDYKWYGGRGITYCDEWKDAKTFCEWALSSGYERGLQLDRIDNSKGYSPENCHFVKSIQNNAIGKRRKRSDCSSGYTGVSFDKKVNKYASRAMINRKNTTIGYFDNPEAAVEARIKWEIETYGEQKTNFHYNSISKE